MIVFSSIALATAFVGSPNNLLPGRVTVGSPTHRSDQRYFGFSAPLIARAEHWRFVSLALQNVVRLSLILRPFPPHLQRSVVRYAVASLATVGLDMLIAVLSKKLRGVVGVATASSSNTAPSNPSVNRTAESAWLVFHNPPRAAAGYLQR